MPDSKVAETRATLRRKILGVKIRHARTRAGLNMKEVGQALGISDSLVSDIEFGRRDVSLPQLEVMALIFNIPVLYFWSDVVIEEPNLNFPTLEAIALRQRIIGVLLRQARIEAGYSQEDVASYLGISTSRISSYEFGKADIPLQELEALANHFQVSFDFFLDQGIRPGYSNGNSPSLDDIAAYSQLPHNIREFLSNPANILYVNIAMKLSNLSAETLRALAEGLLEVTY